MASELDGRIDYRNSRILIGLTVLGSLFGFGLAGLMFVLVLTTLFPLHGLSFDRVRGAFWWMLGAFSFASMGHFLLQQGRRMAYYRASLDKQGVDFQLGTKKDPEPWRIEWDQIAAIKHERVGKTQFYTILGKNGSSARFSSYTFFRTKKLANLIAEGAGQAVEDV